MWRTCRSNIKCETGRLLYYGRREVCVYARRNLRGAYVSANLVSASKAWKKGFCIIEISRQPSISATGATDPAWR